jgi:hypothetical protein
MIVNAVIILFVMDIDEFIYSAISAGSSFWGTKSANHQAQTQGGGGDNSGDGGDKKDDDSIDFGLPKSNGSISTAQYQSLLAPAQHSGNEELETRFMQLEERIRQLERERSLTPTPQNPVLTPTDVLPSVDATSDTSNATV